MTNKRIYLCLAHMSEAGQEQKYIKEALDTNWVVPLGPNVNGFEKDLEDFVGLNKREVALSAGTAAVHLGLLNCGVKAGDEVIVQRANGEYFFLELNPRSGGGYPFSYEAGVNMP